MEKERFILHQNLQVQILQQLWVIISIISFSSPIYSSLKLSNWDLALDINEKQQLSNR